MIAMFNIIKGKINNFVQHTLLKVVRIKPEILSQIHVEIGSRITEKNSSMTQTFSQRVLYAIPTQDYYQIKLLIQLLTKLTFFLSGINIFSSPGNGMLTPVYDKVY